MTSVADIRRSDTARTAAGDVAIPFADRIIYRPLSIYLTPIAHRMGLSANAVSAATLVLSASLPAFALIGPRGGAFAVGLLGAVVLVMDCLDGNLARLRGTASPKGQYLDSIAGKTFALAFPLALALTVDESSFGLGRSGWTVTALVAGTANLWGRESRCYYRLHAAGKAESGWATKRPVVYVAATAVRDLAPFLVVALSPFGLAHVLLLVMAINDVGAFVGSQVVIFARLSRRAVDEPRGDDRKTV